MARDNIIEKLRTLLTRQPFTEESQVVYLMAEIRKILEHGNHPANFSLLNFYCNWLVHIKKDQIAVSMRNIIEPLYKSAKNQIENGYLAATDSAVVDFVYFKELQKELVQFLNDEKLPNSICYGTNCWVKYVKLMCSILSDQPIITPTQDVSSLVLVHRDDGIIKGRIDFTQPISDPKGNQHSSYDFSRKL